MNFIRLLSRMLVNKNYTCLLIKQLLQCIVAQRDGAGRS